MTKLTKLSVSKIAAQLDEPFSMTDIARVGDIIVSVYICQGMLEWHRHVDFDELFWVYEGTMLLESERGDVRLRPGELAVVPKGVEHRSSSGLRASVLLLRCGFLADRKNGRRRLYAAADDAGLQRVSLRDAVQAIAAPFLFRTVAQIEDTILQTAWGGGNWPVDIPVPHDRLLFILNGAATVRTFRSMLHMHPGDFTVVPRGAVYRLISTSDTALVQVARESER